MWHFPEIRRKKVVKPQEVSWEFAMKAENETMRL